MPLRISNADARRTFLYLHGLADSPGRPLTRQGLYDIIERIGFVQVDSIRTVEQAHHQILFSRNTNYKKQWLSHHLEKSRDLFENWTHDASIIPTKFYPYWKPRFERTRNRILSQTYWMERFQGDHETVLNRIRDHIRENGPAMSREMTEGESHGAGGSTWWGWKPSKSALEFLWRTGELAVTERREFQKVYDLSENVVPEPHYSHHPGHDEFVDWACREAIQRLGFATHGEIAAFFDAITPAEAKAWCEGPGKDHLRPVEIELADGSIRPSYGRHDIADVIADAPTAPGRLRALSPFDPMLRDRDRAERLFNFFYKIEVFVPAAKRKYGYYVLPLLEGEKMVGRTDLKTHRDRNMLEVKGLWLEPRLKLTPKRRQKFEVEMERLAKFVGVDKVHYADNWLR